MYLPAPFAAADAATCHDLLDEEGFGLLLAGGDALSPVPFVLDRRDGALGTLRFHLARANPAAKALDGARARLVATGPHGYVSPQWYASRAEVPTWNYAVVVAEGACRRLDGAGLARLLADLAAANEEGPRPWTPDDVPASERETLMRQIVGFSLAVGALVGKLKLSQNREEADRDGVRARLRASASEADRRMLRWLERANGVG